tara:strand:- start:311 stop:604 length:294 start_codon:yes stop_codon:yes gene_type:complete
MLENEPVLDAVQKEMKKEWFKSAVGHQTFCYVGQCRAVLDCKRAVEITIWKGKEPAKVSFYCSKCYDKADLVRFEAEVLTPNGLTLEIVDGRELFKK